MRSYRSLKIAEAIRNELILIFQSGTFEDPRIQDVAISHVELSKDNSNVKIFFTILDESMAKETEKALNHASGYVRTLLAQSLNLGYTPSVRFQFDHVAVAGEKLNVILEKISHNHESAE
jgi:ribosome-binding factor A